MLAVLVAVGMAQKVTTVLAAGTVDDAGGKSSEETFLLGPPYPGGPVVVQARFELRDINEINEETESFEFAGVLTLKWRDPRQAFDPDTVGALEKVFQGHYQFNEISTGWFPQVVLVNESGLFQTSGVVLRVLADGASTLVQTVNAAAEAQLDLRRFPFDGQRLEAAFEVLGFRQDEVRLEVDTAGDPSPPTVQIPQWSVREVSMTSGERISQGTGPQDSISTFVVRVDIQRKPFFMIRLVVLPLVVIVLLSFSVFWMDRSSLGDRISVSFIGILTGVAYQFVVSDTLPRISYMTWIHGFLNFSFFTMCATVVVNLVVGEKDKRGAHAQGDRIDRRCRWIFPLGYFGILLAITLATFMFF